MKTITLSTMLILGISTRIFAQCSTDQVFCKSQYDYFYGTIPLCEDIYDGNADGFTHYIDFPSCTSGDHFVTRFYKRSSFDDCSVGSPLNYDDANPYQLIFTENFDGNSIDNSVWLTLGDGPSPLDEIHACNNNLVYYRDPANVKVQNGVLHLEARKVAPKSFQCVDGNGNNITVTRNFSIGHIETHQGPIGVGSEACFRFGKFDARIKLNQKEGAWDAYWFYGWAGEVDVFETCQGPCNELQTNRYPSFPNPNYDPCDNTPDGQTQYPHDYSINFSQWHTYSFEYTPHKFTISVDGNIKRTFYLDFGHYFSTGQQAV